MGLRSWGIVMGAVALAWVGIAQAEDDPQRFSWHPSLGVTAIADDDPHLGNSSGSAVGLWVAPNLELSYRADAFELQAELGADLRRYLDEEKLSEEFARLSFSAEAGIVPGLTVRLSEAFIPRPERIAAPGDETANLIQTNQFDLEVRYWRELPEKREILFSMRGTHFAGDRFNAELLTDGGAVVFDNNFDPAHLEAELLGEFQNPLGERSAWYVRGQARYRSFDETAVTDHGDISVMLGLRTRRFRNIEIDFAAGWGVISFASRDNVQRFVGEGSVRVRLSNGWTAVVSAANRFVADLSGNNFVETTGRMGVEKFLSDETQLSGAVFFSRLENDAWETDSNLFGGVELRGTHRIGRHAEVSLTYRHWRNSGQYSRDDFSQNRLALELVYRR